MAADRDIFLFADFRLDRPNAGLSRRDERGLFAPVAIGLRALDVLGVLVERAGELVSKEEIMAAVWGRTVVETANLTVQISALRRVLDQGRTEGSCIQTVAARGYRFVAPVTRAEPIDGPSKGSDGPLAPLPPAGLLAATRRRDRRRFWPRTAVIPAVLAITGLAWWMGPRLHNPATTTAVSASPPASAPRLSMVVLPFSNLSKDPGQQYVADGITEDLTTDLSRLPDMLVIARNTAFTYRKMRSRSAVSWACATCWKGASSAPEIRSGSQPS